MTEVIVALDGPNALDLMLNLAYRPTRQRWFKFGPRTLLRNPQEASEILYRAAREDVSIFLDMKWADTRETVAGAFRMAADRGVASVSTYTHAATRACLDTNIKTVKVWQVHALSDRSDDEDCRPMLYAPGVICPGRTVRDYVNLRDDLIWHGYKGEPVAQEIIVPGVRLPDEPMDGHCNGCAVYQVGGLADYVIVGRPIYMAADPAAKLAEYRVALSRA